MDLPEIIADLYPDCLAMDPGETYDGCIMGVVHAFGKEPCIAYNYEKVLARLVGFGMSQEEAVEFFEFNVVGAYMGESTPVFVETFCEWPDCEWPGNNEE